MRFGAMNFPIKPVLQEIEAVGDMGMDFFELAMDPPQAHYSQIRMQKNAIGEALKRHGLELICHMPTFVNPADLTEGIRRASVQEVLESLATAADLGAEKVVLHPGYSSGMGVYVMNQVRTLALESLWEIARRAAGHGIRLCAENLMKRGSPFVTPEDFDFLFENVPELMLTLDTGHAHIGDKNGRRVVDFIERHGSRLAHVHVSDNQGVRDDHLPIGAGTIDFESTARALRGIGYQDTVTLEIFVPEQAALMDSRRRFEKMMSA
jgi:sugar phosphate isomerase/epimerase